MPIVLIIVTIAVVGVIMYLINTYVPMPAAIKTILNVVVVLCLCVWLLSVFGILDYTLPMHGGRTGR